VKNNATQRKELAALHALGALDGDDVRQFAALLQENQTRRELAAFAHVTEALAKSVAGPMPSPDLKQRILAKAVNQRARTRAEAEIKKLVPPSNDGLAFLKDAGAAGWVPLPVAGASVKLLSFDEASEYAVVLGKLEPGSRYPSHRHVHPEDIFMISGDLHVGEEVIRAGDFHHADAGSRHGVNWSETGCVLICVLSKQDLLAQLAPA
jgi:anti-sigma factor ChrR (cupin superfamily)